MATALLWQRYIFDGKFLVVGMFVYVNNKLYCVISILMLNYIVKGYNDN